MIPLTLETLTKEQKEFLQKGYDGDYDKALDIKIIKHKSKYVEYGDQLCTITFEHAGVKYECAYVFETGPATYDWDNAAAEDCYLEVVVPKVKEPEPFTSQEILDEMDADMEESGMAQGEIESNLNHWRNKYLITRR